MFIPAYRVFRFRACPPRPYGGARRPSYDGRCSSVLIPDAPAGCYGYPVVGPRSQPREIVTRATGAVITGHPAATNRVCADVVRYGNIRGCGMVPRNVHSCFADHSGAQVPLCILHLHREQRDGSQERSTLISSSSHPPSYGCAILTEAGHRTSLATRERRNTPLIRLYSIPLCPLRPATFWGWDVRLNEAVPNPAFNGTVGFSGPISGRFEDVGYFRGLVESNEPLTGIWFGRRV